MYDEMMLMTPVLIMNCVCVVYVVYVSVVCVVSVVNQWSVCIMGNEQAE